jgi:hypothetical protein
MDLFFPLLLPLLFGCKKTKKKFVEEHKARGFGCTLQGCMHRTPKNPGAHNQ